MDGRVEFCFFKCAVFNVRAQCEFEYHCEIAVLFFSALRHPKQLLLVFGHC